MVVCRQCRWFRPGMVDPRKGLCIAGKYEAGEEEATSGTAQSVIPARSVDALLETCLYEPSRFEPKAAHKDRERLRESF